jgi:hypothetical protein
MLAKGEGMTLFEIIVASVIGALVAGGTLMAFVTASRLSKIPTAPGPPLAQQTIERFRNNIACDDPWFDPGTCQAKVGPLPAMPLAWTDDLPVPPGLTRQYKVQQSNCDGVGPTDDCLQVSVKVTW